MTKEAQDQDIIRIKRKRSRQPRGTSPLGSTRASGSSSGDVSSQLSVDQFIQGTCIAEEEDMANCLILLAKGQRRKPLSAVIRDSSSGGVEVYVCKTCNKNFFSFQALGGHRASHKKPINPATYDVRNTILSLGVSANLPKKARDHECSICGAKFASGQALGGHMRRHRPLPLDGTVEMKGAKMSKNILSLDLNLPAPDDHQRESSFDVAQKEQVTVFSASSLVHCHY